VNQLTEVHEILLKILAFSPTGRNGRAVIRFNRKPKIRAFFLLKSLVLPGFSFSGSTAKYVGGYSGFIRLPGSGGTGNLVPIHAQSQYYTILVSNIPHVLAM